MRDTLDRLAALGPYFTAAHGARPDAALFRPATELYGGAFASYAALTGARMGTDDPRVAASTVHLGLLARLCSLSLGATALSGRVLDLAPDRLRWHLADDGALTLWLPHPRALPGPPVEALRTALAAHLGPLGAAVRAQCGLSPHTLRGNAASALVGALRVLLDRFPDAPRPPAPLVAALLDAEPLAGAGTFVHEEGLGVAFLRRSCCLYYRVPGGGLCGDCVLRAAPARKDP